jgi:hypothetical protein
MCTESCLQTRATFPSTSTLFAFLSIPIYIWSTSWKTISLNKPNKNKVFRISAFYSYYFILFSLYLQCIAYGTFLRLRTHTHNFILSHRTYILLLTNSYRHHTHFCIYFTGASHVYFSLKYIAHDCVCCVLHFFSVVSKNKRNAMLQIYIPQQWTKWQAGKNKRFYMCLK